MPILHAIALYNTYHMIKQSFFFAQYGLTTYNKEMKNKVLENKKQKKEKLLQAAFFLLSQKDIVDVTVNDIVKQAGLAKGTFYLYFKDKYNIRDILIQKETAKLFKEALDALNQNDIQNFEDAIVFVINHILLALENNQNILRFIQKNLSFGIFHAKLKNTINENTYSIVQDFSRRAEKAGYHFERPDIVLYMIIELTGSTCYDSILHGTPLPIDEYRPYLYNAIRAILDSQL